MRDLNGTKIIAIDHGYGNVKTANTVTPTGLIAYDSEPIFTGGILEYDGKFYRVGEGHKIFIANKATDDDNYLLTLMAVAKELNIAGLHEADVHLAAGLPMTWIRHQREAFRAYLMQNERVAFRFNGKVYRIRIVGCSLYPQGYPAIVNRLGEFGSTNILADIGNGTMNVLYLVNRRPVESKCWTEKLGVDQCVTAARNAVMDSLGVKIGDSIVEQILRTGTADIGRPYLDCISAAAKEYAKTVFDTLRRYEYNPDLMRLFIVGGGGCVVKNFGDYDKERVTIIEDICATAKGYEYLAYTALRKEKGV